MLCTIFILAFLLSCSQKEKAPSEISSKDKEGTEEVTVGVEPFPPLITEDGGGYTINMLKELEKACNFKFKIEVMSYTLAKYSLQNGSVDLIAHTPYKSEVEEFYEYAQEVNWSIGVATDYYSLDKEKLKSPEKYTIGTPSGNAKFYSEILGIPVDNFFEGELENLLRMLAVDREIDIFLFERGSTMSKIKELNLKNIYYKEIPLSIDASMAVRKSEEGDQLRQRLEQCMTKVDLEKIFERQLFYVNMPDSGIVSW